MTPKKRLAKTALHLAGIFLLQSTIFCSPPLANELSPDDCIKCHDQQPKDILASGEAHRTEVNCIDCHEGHPPRSGEDIIPSCSKCHEGTPHFELENCISCHNNPHTPLVITIDKNVTEPCLTCHTDQMAQLQQYESKHTSLDCSNCHRSTHGMIPACTQCHSPHSKDMTPEDCLTCHKPHMPLQVTYPADISSQKCAACHEDVLSQLQANPAKHQTLSCATCHQEKHKAIPKCQNCHGDNPHPPAMHKKFPECGQCHGIAHDLNK